MELLWGRVSAREALRRVPGAGGAGCEHLVSFWDQALPTLALPHLTGHSDALLLLFPLPDVLSPKLLVLPNVARSLVYQHPWALETEHKGNQTCGFIPAPPLTLCVTLDLLPNCSKNGWVHSSDVCRW